MVVGARGPEVGREEGSGVGGGKVREGKAGARGLVLPRRFRRSRQAGDGSVSRCCC